MQEVQVVKAAWLGAQDDVLTMRSQEEEQRSVYKPTRDGPRMKRVGDTEMTADSSQMLRHDPSDKDMFERNSHTQETYFKGLKTLTNH